MIIAINIFRASGNPEQYSKKPITYDPNNWNGYFSSIQNLITLKRLEEAKQKLEGLEKIPNQVHLIKIATNVYRETGNLEKSLKYSKKLITYDPNNWNGYLSSAQDLSALGRHDEALK